MEQRKGQASCMSAEGGLRTGVEAYEERSVTEACKGWKVHLHWFSFFQRAEVKSKDFLSMSGHYQM